MEGISAYGGARGGCIAFYYLHVADRAEVIIVFVFFLFNDHVSSWYFYFRVFQEVTEFVIMDASVGDYISEFFIVVGVTK